MATETDTLLLQIKADNAQLLSKLNQTEKTTKATAKNMTKAMGAFGVAFSGAFAIRSVKNIALASDEMVRLNARLLATTGSAQQAAEAMEFLQKTANKQSVDLLDLSNAYTRLLPAVNSNVISMDEMRQILTLANDNIKALGLGAAEAQGLFLGLSQALGSGTVTMEDLRQVTDRLPGSLSRIAKSTGLTVNEFKKLIATGTVTADMVKGGLIEAFKANEGAAKKMANTLDSATIRMENSLRNLAAAIGESGLNAALVNLADTITAVSDSTGEAIPTLKRWGQTILENIPALMLATAGLKAYNIQQERQAILARDFVGPREFIGPIQEEIEPEAEFMPSPVLRDEEDPTTGRQRLLDELAEFEEQKLQIERDAATKKFEEFAAREMELQDFINQSRGTQLSKTDDFLKRMKDLETASASTRIAVGSGMFGQLLSEGAKHNKKLFALNKAAGIANAVIYTSEGMMKAIAQLGPIAGPVAAAGIAAMGAAQIATIASQSFSGGGGGAASPVASTAAAPVASAGGGGGGGGASETFINIQGVDRDATLTGQQLDEIISGINDRIDSGAIIKGINFG